MAKLKFSLLSCLLLLIGTQISVAQVKTTMLDKNSIPKSIKYTGHIMNAVRYTDNDGDHLVITTETGKVSVKEKDFEGKSAELHAYHYKVTGNDYQLTWKTYDFIKNCEFDVFVGFVPNTFAVTDLNNDNKAEVWLMYNVVCKSDVSPSPMKIIMHEGNSKYAIRGENRVKVSAKDFIGGKYTFDDVFQTGPQVFRTYAADLWKKNILETLKTQAL